MMKHRIEIFRDATLYLGDCLEVMTELEPVDAVVTDPPYGIGEAAGKNHSRGHKDIPATKFEIMEWDNNPASPEQVKAVLAVGAHHIIFGGNYFNLPPSSCWLVWDKDNTGDFADCELAWTDLKMAVRLLKFRWNGMLQEDMKSKERRVHPTQKPIPVMEWCLGFIPDAETILDPFMGSGTTGVACMNLGRKFIGIEIEAKYFDIACRRIELAAMQEHLPFIKKRAKPKQEIIEGIK